MKILFVGDVHLSDTTPRSRKDNYTQAIFDKMRQCAQMAKGYKHVVFLGDIFHKKKPENNSHALVGGFMDILQEFPRGNTHALVGNHDIRDGNMGCLPEQPLGVIFRTGLLHELKKDELWLDGGRGTSREEVSVQISPLPFSYEAETNPKYYDCERMVGADFVVRLTHASILPEGLPHLAYKMPHVAAEQVWGQNWDVLVNGHIHHHSEVVGRLKYSMTSAKQYFVNIGAVARGALNSFSLEQTPRILGVEFKRGDRPEFTWHDLNVKPAAEVFRVEEKMMLKDRANQLGAFVDKIKANESRIALKAQEVSDFPVMLEEYLTGQKADPVVARKVKEYVGVK